MGLIRYLLLGIMAFTMFYAISATSKDAPETEASNFLQLLSAGDTEKLVLQFGDNTCNCQPRGGYIAFLKYESGEPENLAFLLKQKPQVKSISGKPVPTTVKFAGGNLPWEVPESSQVDVRLAFEGDKPYFLPLETAYGYNISKEEFEQFAKDPKKDFESALALRLRPTIEPGLIPHPDPNKKGPFTSDVYKDVLSPEQARYLRPMDPGKVVLPNDKRESLEELRTSIPRLKEATLRLLVVRRSAYKPWQVKKGTVRDPVFELPDGETVSCTSDQES